MPSRQRVADAAIIAPYLTHAVSHHGQLTLIPPENTGRIRKAKGAKKTRPRPDRNVRPDDEPRFNIGSPRPPRSQPSSPGRGRRPGRGRFGRGRDDEYNEDHSIPDYPPPSFQEAISTPAAHAIPGTAPPCPQFSVNPPSPPLHLQPPSAILSQEPPSPISPSPQSLAGNPRNSGSESDTSSIEIVELEPSQTQWDEDRTLGLTLDERVKRELYRQRQQGVAEASTLSSSSPGPSQRPNHSSFEGRSRSGRGVLESDSETEAMADSALSAPVSMKRRHVSQLKYSQPLQERAMSAHPSGSPYSFHLSPSQFFRSTTSLRLPLSSSAPSIRSENFVSRKLFLSKGKERARSPFENEPLDSWEVVDEEPTVPPPEAAVPASPLRPVTSWFTRTSKSNTTPDTPPNSPLGDNNTTHGPITHKPVEYMSLRDRKVPPPPISFLNRPVRRPPPPPVGRPAPSVSLSSVVPSNNSPTAPSPSTELPSPSRILKKGRPPPPPPLSKERHVVPRAPPIPPLSFRTDCAEDRRAIATLERALEIPLPPTPSDMLSFEYDHRAPVTPTMDRGPLVSRVNQSQVSVEQGPPSPNSEWESRSPFADHYGVESNYHESAYTPRTSPSARRAPSPLSDGPAVRAGRHYPGRPLPRPPPVPPQADIHVSVLTRTEVHPPEDLLAGFGDSSRCAGTTELRGEHVIRNRAQIPGRETPPSTKQSPPQVPPSPSTTQPPSTPLDHAPTPVPSPPQPPSYSYLPPALPSPQRASPQPLSNTTDLDVLLAQVGENQNGSDYETLLLVSEFIGPATPAHNSAACSSTDQKRPTPSLLGKIEIDRRRITKDGRVKLKLSLLGVTVDRCGICLSQFKEGELAGLGATCQHAFHERCLGSWLARSRTCPMCRVPLDAPGS